MAVDNADELGAAKLLVTLQALLASKAGIYDAADAHSITNLELLHAWTELFHDSDDLLTWHKRKYCTSSLVLANGHIVRGNSTEENFYANLTVLSVTSRNVDWLELLATLGNGPGDLSVLVVLRRRQLHVRVGFFSWLKRLPTGHCHWSRDRSRIIAAHFILI